MLTDNPDIFLALTNILRNSLGWNGSCINILYLMIYQSVRSYLWNKTEPNVCCENVLKELTKT